MAHWIPLAEYTALLHGYRSEATVKGYANGSISPSGEQRIEAKKVKINPKRKEAWCVDLDGEGAKALISKAQAWKAEMEKPTVEELLEDARAEIESLHDTIDKLNNTIASKNKTIDDMRETIDKLQKTIDSMEKERPKRQGKRSSAEQAKTDAELLERWRAYAAAHKGATKKDFAAAIGRPATTVRGGIRRAEAAEN